jgi:hypothetical protein
VNANHPKSLKFVRLSLATIGVAAFWGIFGEERIIDVKLENLSREFLKANVGKTFRVKGVLSNIRGKGFPHLHLVNQETHGINLFGLDDAHECEDAQVELVGKVIYIEPVPNDVRAVTQTDGGDYYGLRVIKYAKVPP